MKSWGILLCCLVLSASLWLIHNLSKNYTDTVSVPVVAMSNIKGRSNMSVNEVVLVARCNASGFYFLTHRRSSSVKVFFDAGDFYFNGLDTYIIPLSNLSKYSESIFGDRITVEAFISGDAIFKFSPENFRKLPVKAVHELTYKPQYISNGEIRLSPDSVLVYGRGSVLESLDAVYTMPIHLYELSRSRHGQVNLKQPAGTRLSASSADYFIDVVRFVEVQSSFEVKVRNLPQDVDFFHYPINVTLSVKYPFPTSRKLLEKVECYIDYDEFASSISGVCLIRCEGLPEDYISYEIKPPYCGCAFHNAD